MSNKKKKMEDRISLLADSLLHHILSSLNTKLVVQTCVLSKRWKALWTRIPTLNFDSNSYLFKRYPYDDPKRSFKRFIFIVLSEHYCAQIQSLSYTAYDSSDVVLIELLLCYARRRNVRELCIVTNYNIDVVYDWKYCISACSSLTVLKITRGFADNWGELMLPSLKILEIDCKWESDLEYKGIKMFSGCPNLESLVLIDFCFESATICAPKLENLELRVSFDWVSFPELELLAPNLKTVKFRNILPTLKFDLEFMCIHEVIIDVEDSEDSDSEMDDESREEAAANFSKLLTVFSNATSFTLPMEKIQVDPSLSSFHNLKHLKLKTKVTDENEVIDLPITILANLLKCPNLQTLGVLN